MGHFNIATEGIRAGRNIFAKLGFGQVPTPPTPSDGYSLVPFPMQYKKRERQKLLDPLFSLIQIIFDGKEENFFFNCIHDLLDTRIEIKLIKKKKKDINIKVELEGITISSPIINVRNKKYDSSQ